MRETRFGNSWLLAALALVLLVGNTFAPFHASVVERAHPLAGPRGHHAHSAVRFRAVPHASVVTGHRAVVGLAAGGRDFVEINKRLDNLSTLRPPPDDARRPSLPTPGLCPSPPLRC